MCVNFLSFVSLIFLFLFISIEMVEIRYLELEGEVFLGEKNYL